MKTGLAAFVVLVSLPGMIAAQTGTDVIRVDYRCDRGVDLPVVFINPAQGDRLAVITVEGKLVEMRAIPSGSGARYVAFDEQDSYRLYTKGNDAFVTHMYADHTAQEVEILTGCVAAPG